VYIRRLISGGGGDLVINLKAPERGSVAERSERGSSGVLVLAMDDAGLAEALPVAYARAAALGARVTVCGPAKMPFWWAVAASGWMMVPRPWADDARVRAELLLREKVGRLTDDAECTVVCRHGRAEAWLGRVLGSGRYSTVLVGTRRLSGRRTRRLAGIAGAERMFAVLKPLDR
jgi:hypothetical protein